MTLSKNFCLLAFGFIISVQQSIAQNEILFQVKFSPNKTYVTDMTNSIDMDMNFDVAPEKKKQMEGAGMKFPMHMNMLQEMTISTKTGVVAPDKRIPITITYDKVGITMNVNGQEMKQPNSFVGMKINAFATEAGKLMIDSIEGNSSAATKEALEKMLLQMLRNVELPNKTMKVGDTFTQEVPMELPVNGNNLKMLASVTYSLKEIRESQAFFDYTQSVNMNFNLGEGNSKASGWGKGKMVYDLRSEYITDTNGDMEMVMDMQMREMAMKINMKIKNSMKVKVL